MRTAAQIQQAHSREADEALTDAHNIRKAENDAIRAALHVVRAKGWSDAKVEALREILNEQIREPHADEMAELRNAFYPTDPADHWSWWNEFEPAEPTEVGRTAAYSDWMLRDDPSHAAAAE